MNAITTRKNSVSRWWIALCAALSIGVAHTALAEDDAIKNLELRLEGECDPSNSRLWIINNHATKTIIASIRWSLANSKRVASDQFQVGPGGKREVGCAAKADIVSATYAPAN